MTEFLNYVRAIQRSGLMLKRVPKELKIPELCLLAVQQNGYAIQFVKDQTEDICLAAVQQNGLALKYVFPECQTYMICRAAIENNPDAIVHIQNEQILRDLTIIELDNDETRTIEI